MAVLLIVYCVPVPAAVTSSTVWSEQRALTVNRTVSATCVSVCVGAVTVSGRDLPMTLVAGCCSAGSAGSALIVVAGPAEAGHYRELRSARIGKWVNW